MPCETRLNVAEDGAPPPSGLSLRRDLFEEIIDHCRDGFPHEACGIVAGVSGRGKRVYRLTNVHPEPERRYLIDGKQQLAVFHEMRAAGHELVAIFHSHPRTAAYPSTTDIDFAYYPDAFYVIVSMATEPPDVRAFRINRDQDTVRSAPIKVYNGRETRA